MSERLQAAFPGLGATPFQITSPEDAGYNCIAWAAGDTDNWWWPLGDPQKAYWPDQAPRVRTFEAFRTAFASLGYSECDNDALESSVEKVALFADSANTPTHAARQLPSGSWTSKLGQSEDIEHELHALEGEIYGTVVLLLKRPRVEAEVHSSESDQERTSA